MSTLDEFQEHARQVQEGLEEIKRLQAQVQSEYAEMAAIMKEAEAAGKAGGILLKPKQKRAPRGSKKRQAVAESFPEAAE